ncbi:MAG: hypothetical protein QOH12_1477 [Solirubrobacteraceae bacterium]|jgi:hypothetical protein|nr:hypothetical protein [Solirubrobacteraceae bacterium]
MQVARVNSLPTASAIALTIAAVMLPGSATAKIVVGQSLAGVRLDDSKARVKSLLGRPNCQSCGSGKVVWSFGAPLIGSVGFDSRGRVDGVSTSSAHQSTTKGIHPYSSQRARNGLPTIAGSTEKRIMGTYHSARCGLGPELGQSFQCQLTSAFHGRTVITRFLGINEPGYGVKEVDIQFG